MPGVILGDRKYTRAWQSLSVPEVPFQLVIRPEFQP
jgi:hypothetical protein